MKFLNILFALTLGVSLPTIGQSQSAIWDREVGEIENYYASFGAVSRTYAGEFKELYVYRYDLFYSDERGTETIMIQFNSDAQQVEYQSDDFISTVAPHNCGTVIGKCVYERTVTMLSGEAPLVAQIERNTWVEGEIVYYTERDLANPGVIARETCSKVDEFSSMLVERDTFFDGDMIWYVKDIGILPDGMTPEELVDATCPLPDGKASSK